MNTNLRTLLGVMLCVISLTPALTAAENAVAKVSLGQGWATFGVALPAGAAKDAVRVGELPAQTDVKTRWPDGSIRFAVVTTSVDQRGELAIHAAPAADKNQAVAPKARIDKPLSVRFNIGGAAWVAEFPRQHTADRWLEGPLVTESRTVVTPVDQSGAPHRLLRVLFDARVYRDSQTRLDVTVENCLDLEGAAAVAYDVDVSTGATPLFRRERITHDYLTRWRLPLALGLREAAVEHDFAPFYETGALPRFLPEVTNQQYAMSDARFDILGRGELLAFMPDHGGRPEIVPYPDWIARLLVHQHPTQKMITLVQGDLAGSWPVHIREPDGGLVSIDRRPGFWLDGRERGATKDGPKAVIPPGGPRLDQSVKSKPFCPDNAHQPSLAYVPYLITGDRYYADEMADWANYVLLSTWPNSPLKRRDGLLFGANQVRGIAWGLRNLVDAAAYLPDADPRREYFAVKVATNLRYADRYAEEHQTPLGTAFDEKSPEPEFKNLWTIPRPWQSNYVAWSLDHARRQGFAGGSKLLDKLIDFQLRLYTSGSEFPREYGAPYRLIVGKLRPDGGPDYFTSLSEMFRASFTDPSGERQPPIEIDRDWGAAARLTLLLAVERNRPGAQEALRYLDPQVKTFLSKRAGWAIQLEPSTRQTASFAQ